PSIAIDCRRLPSIAIDCRRLPSIAVDCRRLPSSAVECHRMPSLAVECGLCPSPPELGMTKAEGCSLRRESGHPSDKIRSLELTTKNSQITEDKTAEIILIHNLLSFGDFLLVKGGFFGYFSCGF
ncbi:MAG: hypothetical protein PHT80_10980, partial [Lentisphaeria bacterium]|nr:hypothetical protein [Lentisphaeria bacterium]